MMKKLVSVLLMLALVCGCAVAMAAEIPSRLTDFDDANVKFDLMRSRGSSRAVYENGEPNKPGYFKARYYFTGELENYRYTFDCGCTVQYNPFGELSEEAEVSCDIPSAGGTHIWDEEKQLWVKRDGSSTYMPDDNYHAFSVETHKAPLALKGTDGTRPELNAADVMGYSSYAELRDMVLSTFDKPIEQVEGTPIADERDTSQKMSIVEKDGMYAVYFEGDFLEAYVGSLVFNNYFDESLCRLFGDPNYGVNTIGHYDWETGELFEYQFYTADRMMNAVYSVKNVLLSYEVWDNTGAWWGFYNDEWHYAADGDPNNNVVKTPTAEILEKVLHAPAPATYESACVTSESQLSEDEKGVPYIVASASDINNATVVTEATQSKSNLRETVFDISLKDANNNDVDLAADSVTLTLGYPAGMPQDIADDYEFAVVHDGDNGEEVMTTMTGDITLTANGPQVTATGFSPYSVIWGTADELAEYAKKASAGKASTSLPQTGDDSMLLVWAALLAVSCTALVMKKRSRA